MSDDKARDGANEGIEKPRRSKRLSAKNLNEDPIPSTLAGSSSTGTNSPSSKAVSPSTKVISSSTKAVSSSIEAGSPLTTSADLASPTAGSPSSSSYEASPSSAGSSHFTIQKQFKKLLQSRSSRTEQSSTSDKINITPNPFITSNPKDKYPVSERIKMTRYGSRQDDDITSSVVGHSTNSDISSTPSEARCARRCKIITYAVLIFFLILILLIGLVMLIEYIRSYYNQDEQQTERIVRDIDIFANMLRTLLEDESENDAKEL